MSIGISTGTALLIGAGVSAGAATAGAVTSADAIGAQEKGRSNTVALGLQYGQMSPGEIASINQMMASRSQYYSQNLAQIQKQQQLLDAQAPQVGESGKNLLDLLQGKASAMLGPITAQRNIDRQNLVSQLSSQMGGGWAQSSAGIQAMTMFDQGTDQLMAQSQQQALGQATQTYSTLFGQQLQGQAGITQATMANQGQDQAIAGTVLQAQQYGTTRLSNAVQGGVSNSPINYANQPGAQVAQGLGSLAGQINFQGQQQQNFSQQQQLLGQIMGGQYGAQPTAGAASNGLSLGVNTNVGLSQGMQSMGQALGIK